MDLDYMSDGFLFNFQTILLAKQYNLKIAEVPVFANYSLPHTSHKLFGRNSVFYNQFNNLINIYDSFLTLYF